MLIIHRHPNQIMDNHFSHGITLELPNIGIATVLIDGQEYKFDDLDINEQRAVISVLKLEKIKELQGDKIALYCMGKVSLYDTYDEARQVELAMRFFDCQIYLPHGAKDIDLDKDQILIQATCAGE
jgi:hypothetical protein